MSVTIEIPQYLQKKADGESAIDVRGDTVLECLEALVCRYPALKGEIIDGTGTLLLKWMISINGDIVNTSDELSHPVKNGDLIVFVPLLAGG
jgi:molybdopterin converting factor small subunit